MPIHKKIVRGLKKLLSSKPIKYTATPRLSRQARKARSKGAPSREQAKRFRQTRPLRSKR